MTLIDLCTERSCDTCQLPPIAKRLCQSHEHALDSLKDLSASRDPAAGNLVEIEILGSYSVSIHQAMLFGLTSYNLDVVPLLNDISQIIYLLLHRLGPEKVQEATKKILTDLISLPGRYEAAKKEPVH